jgi:hypothetical protein
LLIGGAVAAVLSPRVIYALAGLFGVAAATAIAVVHAVRTTKAERPVLAAKRGYSTSRHGKPSLSKGR